MFRRTALAVMLALGALSCTAEGEDAAMVSTEATTAPEAATIALPVLVPGDRPTEMTREAGDPRTVALEMLERYDARYRSGLLAVSRDLGATEGLDYWDWTAEEKVANALEHACPTQAANGADQDTAAQVLALSSLLEAHGVNAGELVADTAQLNRDLIGLGLC